MGRGNVDLYWRQLRDIDLHELIENALQSEDYSLMTLGIKVLGTIMTADEETIIEVFKEFPKLYILP